LCFGEGKERCGIFHLNFCFKLSIKLVLLLFLAKMSKSFVEVYPDGVQLSPTVMELFERKRLGREAVTFDEVTLEDKPSDFHPNDVDVKSFISRKISLKGCGLLSAAMDTVTERELALAIAKMGGIGKKKWLITFFFLFFLLLLPSFSFPESFHFQS
jgi:hypothetical protein